MGDTCGGDTWGVAWGEDACHGCCVPRGLQHIIGCSCICGLLGSPLSHSARPQNPHSLHELRAESLSPVMPPPSTFVYNFPLLASPLSSLVDCTLARSRADARLPPALFAAVEMNHPSATSILASKDCGIFRARGADSMARSTGRRRCIWRHVRHQHAGRRPTRRHVRHYHAALMQSRIQRRCDLQKTRHVIKKMVIGRMLMRQFYPGQWPLADC